MSAIPGSVSFQSLQLSPELLQALDELGYESPSPIQAETIPHLLAGRDVLGQAQTGTGKTAAFALPVLSRLDLSRTDPQVLVLAPTRELALQVAEAFQSYARHLKGFHVLPIYGGQGYDTQLRQLRRGVQVVVGTPGRVMDHIGRGTLKLDALTTLVLDEADEMLRMGFIDDVEWVLTHTPPTRQIALFSATMPKEIRRVAESHLKDPVLVKIASKTTTATTIRQRYWPVSGLHKLDALTRILEAEPFEAMLVFVRTKLATQELAEKLTARGYAAEALNGDIAQAQREKIVTRLKGGKLDIVIATDVAARGLDVERISHVVNYDIPYDTEAYVHRIGRTGRAGRSGQAILFVAPRERRMLAAIERATGQPIEPMTLPSTADINQFRIQRFGQRISDTLATADLAFYERLLGELQRTQETDPLRLAAALAYLLQGDQPLLLDEREPRPARDAREPRERPGRYEPGSPRDASERPRRLKTAPDAAPIPLKEFPDVVMQRYRVDVGHADGVKPGNIVGAIANEANMDSCYIGHIEIFEDFTTVDLPDAMPKDVMHLLQKARVCGRPLGLRPFDDKALRGHEAGHERQPAQGRDDGAPRKPRAARPDARDEGGYARKVASGKPPVKHRKGPPAGDDGRDHKPARARRGNDDKPVYGNKPKPAKPGYAKPGKSAKPGASKPKRKPRD